MIKTYVYGFSHHGLFYSVFKSEGDTVLYLEDEHGPDANTPVRGLDPANLRDAVGRLQYIRSLPSEDTEPK